MAYNNCTQGRALLCPEKEKECIYMSFTTVAVGKQPNVQDSVLSILRRTAARVTVFLVNGFQLRGVITAFDPYVVVLVTDGKQQVIYKHAISTITPEKAVNMEE